MTPDPFDVAISVVNTNNRTLVEGCLRSIPEACTGLRWKASVVDNASEDGSAALIETSFPWAALLRNQRRRGFSANHNEVITRDRDDARYVLILNEDTELDPSSVTRLVAHADRHPRSAAVGPAIRRPDGVAEPSRFAFPTVRSEVRSLLWPRSRPRLAREAGWLNGSCVLLRSSALREVGLLDERFFIFYEDTDLCLRLSQAGWSSERAHDAGIVHHGHQTVSHPSVGTAMHCQVMRSRYLYIEKHMGRAPAAFVGAVGRVSFALRAAKAVVVRRAGSEGREDARLFVSVLRYNPTRELPHESGQWA